MQTRLRYTRCHQYILLHTDRIPLTSTCETKFMISTLVLVSSYFWFGVGLHCIYCVPFLLFRNSTAGSGRARYKEFKKKTKTVKSRVIFFVGKSKKVKKKRCQTTQICAGINLLTTYVLNMHRNTNKTPSYILL